MKKFIFYTMYLIMVLSIVSCDANVNQVLSREYGGTTTINLEPGENLLKPHGKMMEIFGT